MADSPSPDSQLVRVLGTRELTANIVNATIGAGIFLLPATVAAGLGPAAPVAYVVCAALMIFIVLCFAAAGSRVSLTGGLYAYIEVAFGRFAGFIAGVCYLSTAFFSVASVATGFAGSVGLIWPSLAQGFSRAMVLCTLFGGLAFINILGVKPGVRLVEVITAAKLLPLMVLIAVGIWFVHPEYLRFSMPTWSQIGPVAIVLIFAFEGIEVALMPVGEVRDPARTVPRAILGALALTTLMYLAIQTIAQGILGPELAKYSAAPLAETAGRVLGNLGRLIFLAGGTISMFGYVTTDALGTPRAIYALGRDGNLPLSGILSRISGRFRTPVVAIVLYAIGVTVLSVNSSFERLTVLANVSGLVLYLMCVAASFELQRRDVRMGGTPFNLPGGIVIQLLAAGGIAWFLWQAPNDVLVQIEVLGLATVFYAIQTLAVRFVKHRLPQS